MTQGSKRGKKPRSRSPLLMAAVAALVLLGVLFGGRAVAASLEAPQPGSARAGGAGTSTVSYTAQQSSAGAVKGDAQYVTSSLTSGSYDPITVQKGIPVKWTINAPEGSLNGCNSKISIPAYNIEYQLHTGDNLIEFTPDTAGTFPFSCWMGMIRSTISVTDENGGVPQNQDGGAGGEQSATAGGCCGGGGYSAAFANGKIPTDNIGIAKDVDGILQATVKVDGYGYSPAVIVVERGKKFKINFDAAEINGCNGIVNFPAYGGGLDLTKNTSTPALTAEDDFSFECSMGMLHGYVKVVDDLDNVDLDAVRQDAENFVPEGGAAGCCG